MTPRPRRPRALTRLVALLGALGLLALLLVTSTTPSLAAGAPPRGAAEPEDVFTATIERTERDPGLAGRPARYTYTVQVQQVFGSSEVSTVRVQVQTSAAFNQCATRPESRGQTLYVWRLTRQSTRLLADGCRDVLRATDLRLAALEATYGEPRSPIDTSPPQPQYEFPDVAYTCPETSASVPDVADAVATCEDVAAPQDFDRTAAPGLALVLVGVLGWIVVLVRGRTRRS